VRNVQGNVILVVADLTNVWHVLEDFLDQLYILVCVLTVSIQ
jgi:hypothetical protein